MIEDKLYQNLRKLEGFLVANHEYKKKQYVDMYFISQDKQQAYVFQKANKNELGASYQKLEQSVEYVKQTFKPKSIISFLYFGDD